MRGSACLAALLLLVGAAFLPAEATHTETKPGKTPIEAIFGGSLKSPVTRVLLVPPTHGDLGNPLAGPSALDYLEQTVRSIHAWEAAIDLFIADHPDYAYLDEIDIQVEVFDGEVPTLLGYDIVTIYVESGGGVFRGLAAQGPETQAFINSLGLGDTVHYSDRYVLLSLFSNAPRAHQSIPDYPELNDMHTVVMHEFAHTFGLGHTTSWTGLGPDLMNSPYTAVYGDGDPLGDGGERTPALCASSLDLYGLAHLYRWLPSGNWQGTGGMIHSPLPYKVYCV